jgi:hypothetical protein
LYFKNNSRNNFVFKSTFKILNMDVVKIVTKNKTLLWKMSSI